MPFIDIILIIILIGFGLFGLWFGLIYTLTSLVGMIAGLYLASRYYMIAADWLIKYTGWSGNFSRILAFIIAFVLINRLVNLAFWLLNKILKIVTGLPFIRGLDRLLGLLFGLAEGVLVLGAIIFFIARFPVGQTFMDALGKSTLAPQLTKPVAMLLPLLPEALKAIKSTINGIF